MNFTAWAFFWAGLACATIPIVIHLLNRRRYKVVQWGAMDFLRQALQRNRRIMKLRDLLILALRTAAVLLFGMALAQPFFTSRNEGEYDRSRPLHAIILFDNSLSMGYTEGIEDTVLDRAKERAEAFIKELPRGSRVTVLPLCGSVHSYSMDPFRTSADAIDALRQIEPVHRTTSMANAVALAEQAAQAEPNLAKRIVLFGDQQESNWRGSLSPEQLKQFPAMQIVDVSPKEPANSWIEDFRLEDGIADVETPANFSVRLRHQGEQTRKDVQVSLTVEDEVVAVKTVTLEPGSGDQEVTFKHTFSNISTEPGRATNVPVKVSLPVDEHDRIAADNERSLIAPVVSAVPVVFVDQLGASGENPSLNRLGETRQLRRLLVPVVRRGDTSKQLVRIEHCTLDELDEDLLSEARLVVVAGIEDPTGKVELLREFVEQGGQLLIAAGGDFKPAAWTSAAWQEGAGILPLPLSAYPFGQLPEEADANFKWFELAYNDMMKAHAFFGLAGVTDEELSKLYGEALFFKAVVPEDSTNLSQQLLAADKKRIDEQDRLLAAIQSRRDNLAEAQAKGTITPNEQAQLQADEDELRRIRPQWLKWANEREHETSLADEPAARNQQLAQLARQLQPQVLAAFNNGLPFLVERKIGEGRVIFCTSGIMPEWNTVARSNTILLFDRVLRGMLESTLPQRTFASQDRIVLPIGNELSGLTFELTRPGIQGAEGAVESIQASYLGTQTRGLIIDNPLYQGIYRIAAYRDAESSAAPIAREKAWETSVAVNVFSTPDQSESEIKPLTRRELEERAAGEEIKLAWVGPSDPISLAGTTIRGQNSWLWLAFAVLLLLLAELALLAWPAVNLARTNAPPQPQ